MTIPLNRFDLPESFICTFRPVRVSPSGNGLPTYLFDAYGLRFFRHGVTADRVPRDAVWTVIADGNAPVLRSGEHSEAIGYVVAERPVDPTGYTDLPLPKRLSYRQRLRRSIIESLMRDIAAAPCQSPPELLEFLRQRLEAAP